MKTYMPLNGLRWSRNSGSANCDMPQSAVFGRPGGVKQRLTFCIKDMKASFDRNVLSYAFVCIITTINC